MLKLLRLIFLKKRGFGMSKYQNGEQRNFYSDGKDLIFNQDSENKNPLSRKNSQEMLIFNKNQRPSDFNYFRLEDEEKKDCCVLPTKSKCLAIAKKIALKSPVIVVVGGAVIIAVKRPLLLPLFGFTQDYYYIGTIASGACNFLANLALFEQFDLVESVGKIKIALSIIGKVSTGKKIFSILFMLWAFQNLPPCAIATGDLTATGLPDWMPDNQATHITFSILGGLNFLFSRIAAPGRLICELFPAAEKLVLADLVKEGKRRPDEKKIEKKDVPKTIIYLDRFFNLTFIVDLLCIWLEMYTIKLLSGAEDLSGSLDFCPGECEDVSIPKLMVAGLNTWITPVFFFLAGRDPATHIYRFWESFFTFHKLKGWPTAGIVLANIGVLSLLSFICYGSILGLVKSRVNVNLYIAYSAFMRINFLSMPKYLTTILDGKIEKLQRLQIENSNIQNGVSKVSSSGIFGSFIKGCRDLANKLCPGRPSKEGIPDRPPKEEIHKTSGNVGLV